MKTYEQGVADEYERITREMDKYSIFEIPGGVLMLKNPEDYEITVSRDGSVIVRKKYVKPGWQGTQHKTGSLSSYFKMGCRCDACRALVRNWQQERKEVRKGNK